jgi:hypothetical protein
VSPKAGIERYEEEKNFLFLSAFTPLTVPPTESDGRMK